MQDTRTQRTQADDPILEQEGLEHTGSDPDQQRPFKDEFDVKPETSSEGGGKGTSER